MKNILIILFLSVCLSEETLAQSKGNTQGEPQVFSKGKSQPVPEFCITGDTMEIVFDKIIYRGVVCYATTDIARLYYRGKVDRIEYTTYSMLDESAVFIKRINGIAAEVQLWKQNFKIKTK
jgi:hypothetical protein